VGTVRLLMQSEQDFWLKFLSRRGWFGVREVYSLPARAIAGASKIFAAGSLFGPPLCKWRCLTMNTQIQEGSIELCVAVRWPILSERDFWSKFPPGWALFGARSMNGFPVRAVAGFSKVVVAGSQFWPPLWKKRRLTMDTLIRKGSVEPGGES